ncbi:MAG: hypothetical protein PHX18_00755 [Candidatus Gastranaerophilales bacterium]|nr:hypothetical protein [Candidatus Gastranaerophilales bacterium]
MVEQIGSASISSIQWLRAQNAFNAAKKPFVENTEIENINQERSLLSDIKTEQRLSELDTKTIEDIKTSGAKVNENLSDEDIKYGFMFGQSVLVDYTA